MSRASAARALLAFAVLAVSAIFAITTSPRLGLDLRGGTQIVLQTEDSPTTRADRASTDRALEVLRRRVDALGVAEPSLARSGERRIIVELPGLQDPREAGEVIGRTAQLTFHEVLDAGPATGEVPTSPVDTSKPLSLPDESGGTLQLAAAALTGEGVRNAAAGFDPQLGTGRFVSVEFTGFGQRGWDSLTAKAACAPPGSPQRRVAIVLDGEVISSPQVDPSVQCGVGIVGGRTQITGSFTATEAADLSALIKGGALPVPVKIIEQRTVGATLGAEAIADSAKAGVIGLILTAVFLVFAYRLVGLVAAVALASYGLISYGTLVALGATLTLPGLAGLLLSAGLAIDANVLVFERAREEVGHRRGLSGALTTGYRKAWSAIADSNATTLLAAGLLFLLASGPVRGFGVTLCIGVAASMVSALIVCRTFTDFAMLRPAVKRRPQVSGIASPGRLRGWLLRRNPDLMRHRNRWLAVSLIAVVLASSGIAIRGLNFGVEFTGGRLMEYATGQELSVNEARRAVTEAGFPQAVVQRSGEDAISVRTSALTVDQEERITTALDDGSGTLVKQRDELIGPTLGSELRTKALIALGVALAMQLAYLAIRFRWSFGTAAVLAMLHDLLIVVGVFAWLGKPIDGIFLAAALTIIGVSVNDSIVTLDRLRETWSLNRTQPLPGVANEAILQTAPRTINTGLGAMFILGALTFLGGSSLTDFALALLLGLIVGTYSSAFTATPLLLALETRSAKAPPMPKRAQPAPGPRPARVTQDSGAVV